MQYKKAEEKNPSVELPKLANRADKFGKPIPYIKTGTPFNYWLAV